MIIGIDLDDVLTDTLPAVIKYHNEVYKTNLKREEFFSFKYWEVWGGTREEAIQKVYDFHQSPYFAELKPIVGTQEALARLKNGNELYLITSRQEVFAEATKNWIKQYFSGIFSDIFITNFYTKSGVSITKREICNQIGADILIDDSIEYALECLAPERKIFLFDSPWNQTAELPAGVTRVYSWPEIIKSIDLLQN
jgi:Uncharacterized protein conserved in bacteria